MLPSSNGSDHAMLNCRHRQSQQISSPFSGEGALDLLGGYFSETRQWFSYGAGWQRAIFGSKLRIKSKVLHL